ncbi:hypothetical protein BJ165DRAFT_1419449 [Panaeolus papilionaceus]|nr:hypothetical protein BJ165DRAFT_1419449 [Panaeolus papilionaceus]
MNAYFGLGGPPPPPPPPSGGDSIVDSSDSDSDYDSDGWRHPHRLRFGARPRVKAHHKHRKSNKHRRTCDAVHALNADPNVNPNQNIQIDIPPGLLLNGDVLPSELEVENEEKMRSLVRFVTMCAGASGASLFVRLVWPPIGKTTLSNDMGLSLQDALDVDIISEAGTRHSSPFKANLTTILGAGNVATQTASAAMWALNNCTFSFPPGVSAYDFDLAMDMGLVFQSDLDLDSNRGVNALATMAELLQRLLWDGAEDCDVPSQLKRSPDWVNFNLSDAPLARTLASEAEGESCARDSDSGVILCVSSSSSSSITSVTSSSSFLLSSRSAVSTEAGAAEDFIRPVESPGVCPNVPSFYTGCEVYAAFFELEPPTKTSPGVTSVGIGMHIPSTSRLRMFGVHTPPVYDSSRASTPHQISFRFTPSILPSLVISRVSSTPAPRFVESKAPLLNPESQANLGNSLSTGPSPSTKSAVKPSKPNLPMLAFNVICAIINIFYGLLYSSHGLLPLLILVALFLAFSGGKNIEKPTKGDPVASGTPGGSQGAPRDVNEIDDKVKNVSSQGPMAGLASSEPKRTPAKISPSKLPVSVTRVEVRDVLRRLDLMYENEDTSIFPSDSSSWSSSESASTEAHIMDS